MLDADLDRGRGQIPEGAEVGGRPSEHASKEAAPAAAVPAPTAAAPRAPRNDRTSASSSPAVANVADGDRLMREAEQTRALQGAALQQLPPEATSDQRSPKLQLAGTDLDVEIWFGVRIFSTWNLYHGRQVPLRTAS